MFKTVFAKYVSAFMAIFLFSFSLLAIILGVMISDYARDDKQESVENAAENIKETILQDYQEYLQMHPQGNFSGYLLSESQSIRRTISAVSDFNNHLIFITDSTGKIVVTDHNAASLAGNVPDTIMAEITAKDAPGRYVGVGTLGELFATEYMFYGVKLGANLMAGVPAGAVFACSSSEAFSGFVDRTTTLIITACLLVLVIGMIACYIISEKISTPIRSISRAAKRFAGGDFKARVQVHGKDEIADLANAFNQMAESLEQLEVLRSSFIANVSHDLRTPMTSISGFIDGILDGVIPPEKYDYYLQIVGTEVKRLSRLVSTLLDVSRIEAGERKFVMKPFDICEMSRQILISFEKKIEEKRLDIDFAAEQDNMYVNADEDAIHQVLYNLIDNAVKFAYEKGLLKICLGYQDKMVVVKVYNEGEGIPAEDCAHIFDRFYKADKSRGLDKTGVGLGLYIVKTIVQSHGGEITLKSREGKDCEFCFTLNRAEKV